ncbi:hypothetical protein ACFOHS_23015 [Jhaorihella thermophila]
MALPIPVLSAENAGPTLTRLWLDIDRAVPGPAETPPGLILAMPTAWANKYQILLYKTAARHRWAVAGVTLPDALEHVSWAGPVVLHAHWFAGIFNGAETEAEAGARLDQAIARILAFRDRTGARLLWTAHNVFPPRQPLSEHLPAPAPLDLRHIRRDPCDGPRSPARARNRL